MRGFVHPDVPVPLRIARTVELPSNDQFDDVQLQLLTSSSKQDHIVGVYTESRRGALGEEVWNHTGYVVGPLWYWLIKHLLTSSKSENKKLKRGTLRAKMAEWFYARVSARSGKPLQMIKNIKDVVPEVPPFFP